MSPSYKSEYPSGVQVDPEIIKFFENFYVISDTPGAHDQYVDLFEKDADFILASKKVKGHEDIKTTRHGMWTAVDTRKHSVPKVFPFGNNADEFMLYGTVDLGLKNGGNASLEWAGRAKVAKSSADGKWRMKYYQVYLDTGATNAYKK